MYNQPYFAGQMAPFSFQGGQMQGMFDQNLVGGDTSQLPMEQSYIENILRLNRGKLATVYMNFASGGDSYNPKVFTGIVEAAGRDHIVLSDPNTGMRYLLLMVFLNYVTFDEEIEYSYPFGQLDTYSPR